MIIDNWLNLLQQQRVIAVIRASSKSLGEQMAKTVATGGIRLIEITWNSADAPELISQLHKELPNCIIGTGTILNQSQLHQAIDVGAQFIFSPHVDTAVIKAAVAANVPVVPGALSPTEIVTAWDAGASCVKVFPIQAVGGASYIKALLGPLGHIPLIPTGGVTIDNAQELINIGAIAVGLSGNLFPKSLIDGGNWNAIAKRAKQLKQRLTPDSLS
ncbi:bifunctional 4-hydroxy-2-oxoglutarate aldolase/2-dehydro-3-deoxy-phosphogluconate aldolase [Moorena producens]|uniref:bifunctional 4-hydroxy-2-oxoglutarate aldolase/2-dehydro-3-deoxy-phosphogluconate aldolase n=1 Tax=Moorena producens TaxID=1155739 RepID=UPI003C77FFFC